MKQFFLVTIALLLTTHTSYAQEGKIDMHGKESSQIATLYYGQILEIKTAMHYKYLKINEQGKIFWIAIADAPVSVGEKIGFDKKTLMKNFFSQSLNQNFEEIYFASDIHLSQKASQPQSMKEMLGITTQNKSVSPNTRNNSDKKPFVKKESYSVEEIFLWRENLKDQTVTVEGTVFKISHNIMQRDWVHLRDGSGHQEKQNNDLVFTAKNTTIKSGEKLQASGKVVIDKDFGYGYFYPVIIENTTFKGK